MNEIITRFRNLGIIPVVVLEDAKDAIPLAKALCEGGLLAAEVTFRTEAAQESIRLMRQAYPNMLIGAGTVLTTEQADRAIEAGAQFIVSPGFNPKVVEHCQKKKICIIPGVAKPTDIEMALEFGIDVLKFFPAEQNGGLAMLKALSAPYTKVKFMPTGGIHVKNLTSYLKFDKVIACGGSWMVPKECIAAGRFEEIQRLTKEAVNEMLGFELRHIGIHASCEKEAEELAETFEHLFGFTKKSGSNSVFAGTVIEVMKKSYRGKHGHIAFGTNDISRAMYHMGLAGITFDKDTARYDENGRITAIYLQGEFGGFAVHLLQN